MNWIKRAWRGEEKLWKVFWIYWGLGGIFLNIFITILKSNLSLIFVLPYLVWISVAQWRCAFNVGWRIWGYIVRILVVLLPIATLLSLIGSDIIKSAECRRDLKVYIEKGGANPEDFKKECMEKQLRDGKTRDSFGSKLSSPLPVTTAVISEKEQAFVGVCKKSMTDVAIKGGVDPVQYIAQNQAYLKQCVSYHAAQGK